MNYPAAELRGIKMNFYLINPDAEHRGILLIKKILLYNYHYLIYTPSQVSFLFFSFSKLVFFIHIRSMYCGPESIANIPNDL